MDGTSDKMGKFMVSATVEFAMAIWLILIWLTSKVVVQTNLFDSIILVSLAFTSVIAGSYVLWNFMKLIVSFGWNNISSKSFLVISVLMIVHGIAFTVPYFTQFNLVTMQNITTLLALVAFVLTAHSLNDKFTWRKLLKKKAVNLQLSHFQKEITILKEETE